MMAFRTSSEAVDFAVDFSINTGVPYIGIRVAIHMGEVQIRENDIYGLNVNFASRIQSKIEHEGILVSERVKEDYSTTTGTSPRIRFQKKSMTSRVLAREYSTGRKARIWG